MILVELFRRILLILDMLLHVVLLMLLVGKLVALHLIKWRLKAYISSSCSSVFIYFAIISLNIGVILMLNSTGAVRCINEELLLGLLLLLICLEQSSSSWVAQDPNALVFRIPQMGKRSVFLQNVAERRFVGCLVLLRWWLTGLVNWIDWLNVRLR